VNQYTGDRDGAEQELVVVLAGVDSLTAEVLVTCRFRLQIHDKGAAAGTDGGNVGASLRMLIDAGSDSLRAGIVACVLDCPCAGCPVRAAAGYSNDDGGGGGGV